MRAAVIDSQKSIALKDINTPELPEGGALVRVIGCGLCGSDLDKLLHRPVSPGTVLGHEVVGEIYQLSQAAGKAHPHLTEGQRVSVAHHVPCQLSKAIFFLGDSAR
jgi:L-iditol 2-dehydrogenase